MIVPSICLLSLIIDHLIDGFLYSGSGLTDFLPDDIDMVMLLTISAVIMIGAAIGRGIQRQQVGKKRLISTNPALH